MNKEKFEKKVIHLILKGRTRKEDRHAYFGSVACIYEHFDSEQIGITYDVLRRHGGVREDKPYENDKVIIRQGKLWTKTQNRKED